MKNVVFQVVDEPYCLWEEDLKVHTLAFLTGFDTGYFDHLLETHLNADDEARSAMALRVAYHHAMETLFSFLGALLQAPSAPQAWIAKCQNIQLYELVRRITNNDRELPTGLSIQSVSWDELARVTLNWYRSGTERQAESISLFAGFWRRLASEFLDKNRLDEYNSLKHGFRVTGGGFGLSVRLEHEYGALPPEDEMQSIGHSEFGSSFRRFRAASGQRGERSLISEHVSVNWKIEKVAPLLQLTSISISNVIGALRILNGEPCNSIKFTRPDSDDALSSHGCRCLPATTLCFVFNKTEKYPFCQRRIFLPGKKQAANNASHQGRRLQDSVSANDYCGLVMAA